MSETIDVMMAVYETNPELVKNTLKSYFGNISSFKNKFRLIVYNDGSPGVGTATWDFLRAAADVYLEDPVNHGISCAWNEMMKHATSEWVFNIDADCTAPENWLDRLIEEKKRTLAFFPNAKWICFKCINKEGKMVFYYRNMDVYGSTVEVPGGDDPAIATYNQFRRVTHGTSFCSLFNREAYLKVGGPDNNIRKQWVDADIGMSLRAAGFDAVVNPNISFIFGEPHVAIVQDLTDYTYFKQKWGKFGDEYFEKHRSRDFISQH